VLDGEYFLLYMLVMTNKLELFYFYFREHFLETKMFFPVLEISEKHYQFPGLEISRKRFGYFYPLAITLSKSRKVCECGVDFVHN